MMCQAHSVTHVKQGDSVLSVSLIPSHELFQDETTNALGSRPGSPRWHPKTRPAPIGQRLQEKGGFNLAVLLSLQDGSCHCSFQACEDVVRTLHAVKGILYGDGGASSIP